MADDESGIKESDKQALEDLSSPRTRIIYEVVCREGEEELDRPPGSLFWSGIAGGVTLMASVIAEAGLHQKLPLDFPGRQLISDVGYSFGFLMVILGRMQLFTEQTIVTVLPVMAAPDWRKLSGTSRLWGIVFAANMIGSCAAAAVNVFLHLINENLLAAMLEVSRPLLAKSFLEVLLQGVPAGFFMASVAWIRAGVTNGEFWIILVLTYAIALGDFTHVVAGSAEAFLLMFAGETGVSHATCGIILPALIGNVIGGTGLFALLAHAQVRQEM